jgi:hypothetical protein
MLLERGKQIFRICTVKTLFFFMFKRTAAIVFVMIMC